MAHAFRHFRLPTHNDEKGSLIVAELSEHLDWLPQRLYWVTRATTPRGVHAHRKEEELFVCIQGRLLAKLHDGEKWHEFEMKGPGDAVYVPAMVWHEFHDFTDDAILLAASSIPYNGKAGYILDFDQFLNEVRS